MIRITLLALTLTMLAFAEAEQTTNAPFSKGSFELGASAGFPEVLGIRFGYWGPKSVPFLFRLVGGLGSGADLGVHLHVGNEEENRLYVAASGGIIGYGISSSILGVTGLIVGMRKGNFYFQAGPALYISGSVHMGAQGSIGLSALY